MGAAIAAGSQLEKGIWALLVIAASVIVSIMRGVILFSFMLIINQCPWFRAQAIEIRIMASPIRFVSAVIIPAARDLGF